jgi:hypothetical protein
MKTLITIASAVAGARNLFERLARGATGYARRAIAAGNDLRLVSQTSATIYHDAPRGELSFSRSACCGATIEGVGSLRSEPRSAERKLLPQRGVLGLAPLPLASDACALRRRIPARRKRTRARCPPSDCVAEDSLHGRPLVTACGACRPTSFCLPESPRSSRGRSPARGQQRSPLQRLPRCAA